LSAIIYDAGVLIAADKNERHIWAEHRVRLEAGILPRVPSTVVAQASRSPNQVQLRRLLKGCDIVALDEVDAHRTGALLAKSRTADIVDASVVALAERYAADILTTDVDDIARLVTAADLRITIVDA
jgi:predicted nucleic acid-binding protein